jgi:hypothetical protein
LLIALSECYYLKAAAYAASIYTGASSSCSSAEKKAKKVKKEHRWL